MATITSTKTEWALMSNDDNWTYELHDPDCQECRRRNPRGTTFDGIFANRVEMAWYIWDWCITEDASALGITEDEAAEGTARRQIKIMDCAAKAGYRD